MPEILPQQIMPTGNNVSPDAPEEASSFAGEETGEDNTSEVQPPASDAVETGDKSTEGKVNFTDFLKAKDTTGETKAKLEAPKEKPAEEEPTDELEEKPAAIEKNKPARDYSIFDPSDREIFKKTSGEAFDRIKGLFTELKQTKEQLAKAPKEQSYVGHPSAYVLHPEYQQAVQNANLASQVEDHWERQLIAVRDGGKWQDLDIDPKTGQLIASQPKDADKNTEIQLSKHLRYAQNQALKQQTKLEGLAENYGKTYQEAAGRLKAIQEQYFKGWDAPTHETADFQKRAIEGLPSMYRDHPLAPLLAQTGAALDLVVKENKRLLSEKGKVAAIDKDAKAAPPTKSRFVAGKPNSNPLAGISMEDFRRAKERV